MSTTQVNSAKVKRLVQEKETSVMAICRKRGFLNLYRTAINVVNNTGNVGPGQRERILAAISDTLGVPVDELYAA